MKYPSWFWAIKGGGIIMAKEKTKPVSSAGLPEIPDQIHLAPIYKRIDWKRIFFILLGLGLFFWLYLMPSLPDAVDPTGKHFVLSPQGKAALGLFLLAGIWWVFEVMPIGVTSIAIGVVQALFAIRSAKDAFRDFMDPSVMFIFGSLLIGLAFTRSGLTRRLAYKMLSIIGENTKAILLGTMIITAALAHFMAHTAAAATVFPILMAIYSLYGEGDRPTKFGKALFVGMAYSAGAGSIATMLGSARAPAGVGMFKEFTGMDITFFELSKYLFPVSWIMVFLIWVMILIFFKPEKPRIEGLKKKAQDLYQQLGPMTAKEIFVIFCVIGVVVVMTLQSFIPAMKFLDRSALILVAGLLFFLTRLLTVKELEEIPWNIIFLIQRGHEYRLLSLAGRHGPMAGRALADHVQGSPLAGLCHEHRHLCFDHDQLHHECGGHRHFPAGGPGHCQISGRHPGSGLLCRPDHGRHALYPFNRGGPQCHGL